METRKANISERQQTTPLQEALVVIQTPTCGGGQCRVQVGPTQPNQTRKPLNTLSISMLGPVLSATQWLNYAFASFSAMCSMFQPSLRQHPHQSVPSPPLLPRPRRQGRKGGKRGKGGQTYRLQCLSYRKSKVLHNSFRSPDSVARSDTRSSSLPLLATPEKEGGDR
jgi:hypothetical protein